MAGVEGRLILEDNFDWNVENEIRLFEAMIGHKPVEGNFWYHLIPIYQYFAQYLVQPQSMLSSENGVLGINKHFHMACISEKFESLLGKPICSDIIWKHLESMYDLAALDKKELLPFPNEPEEFSLPESEYIELINEKLASKTEWNSDSKENYGKEVRNQKSLKDSTLAREGGIKKERKSESEENGTGNDSEKKDITEVENETKKGKTTKEEKAVKTRGKRNMKDRKAEEDLSQTITFGNKKEEDNGLIQSVCKKDKQTLGKRSLRSRVEDVSNKSLTPPPIKRARRI